MDESNVIDPVSSLYEKDIEHMFYCFCSFVCLIRNKKMNIANIFLEFLECDTLQETFIELCDHKTKYEAVRHFLTQEPSLQKSKYIKRYINNNC